MCFKIQETSYMTNLVFKHQHRYGVTTLQPHILVLELRYSIYAGFCACRVHAYSAYYFCTDLALSSQADSDGKKLEFAHLLHQPHALDSCSDDVGHHAEILSLQTGTWKSLLQDFSGA